MAQVAFYVAEYGDWEDKLIAWWTESRFSHVELVHEGWWYSTSPRDGKVRRKKIEPKENHWVFIDVDIDEEWLNKVFKETEGQGYDWINIALTQVIPLGIQRNDKWICSEWVAYVLYKQRQKVNPEELYKELVCSPFYID